MVAQNTSQGVEAVKFSKNRKGVGLQILGISVTLTGWDVLLGGGALFLIAAAAVDDARFLLWIGVALIVVWAVTVFLVNLGLLKPRASSDPAEGGGTPPAAPDVSST